MSCLQSTVPSGFSAMCSEYIRGRGYRESDSLPSSSSSSSAAVIPLLPAWKDSLRLRLMQTPYTCSLFRGYTSPLWSSSGGGGKGQWVDTASLSLSHERKAQFLLPSLPCCQLQENGSAAAERTKGHRKSQFIVSLHSRRKNLCFLFLFKK